MNEKKRPTNDDARSNVDLMLSFDNKIKHLDRGYSNSQSVVRFLDTKAAAAIGAVPVLLGILAAVFTWLHDSGFASNVLLLMGIWFPMLLGMLLVGYLTYYSWKTLDFAFNAISPRDTGASPPSILFPFPHDDFEERLQLFKSHPSEADAVEDYERQLNQMSQLVSTKLEYTKRAISHLLSLFRISLIALITLILLPAFSTAILSICK